MSELEELVSVKDQAEAILERYPEARNNDFYLQWLVLKTYYLPELPYIDWKKINDLSGKLTTVRNVRQVLNRQGLFLPTDPEILERRRNKGRRLRKAIPILESKEFNPPVPQEF